jgi:hypothetical protein
MQARKEASLQARKEIKEINKERKKGKWGISGVTPNFIYLISGEI